MGIYTGTVNHVIVPNKGSYCYAGFVADNPTKGSPNFS
jgi:hypothetical protein